MPQAREGRVVLAQFLVPVCHRPPAFWKLCTRLSLETKPAGGFWSREEAPNHASVHAGAAPRKEPGMGFAIEDLNALDLKTLKGLVKLKEDKSLARLEARRRQLTAELDKVEGEIDKYFRRNPGARRLARLLDEGGGATRTTRRGARRKRRPRGWVGEQVAGIMKGARKPMSPADVRSAIVDKHPQEDTPNLYLAVFQQLNRGAQYKKGKDGWVLKS